MSESFLTSAIDRWIMRSQATNTGPWQRRFSRAVAILLAVGRDIAEGPIPLHASSLVYTTLLSIVPLTALAFSVLKGLGVHNQLAPLLKRALAPLGPSASQIVDRVLTFVDNMHVGVLGATGLVLLFYTSISVGRKVEQAFNEIWHVPQARALGRSAANFLTILIGGPVLLFSAFGLTATLMRSAFAQNLIAYEWLGSVVQLASSLAPYGIVLASFTIFYRVVPNARVRVTSALCGGIAGGIAWAVAGWGFTTFVASSTSYTAIYSAFASLILLLIWLNVDWLVLLAGCSVAFYFQNPQYLSASSRKLWESPAGKEAAALSILRTLGRAYYSGSDLPDIDDLTKDLALPHQTVESTLTCLEAAGLLARIEADPPRWIPAKPYEMTSLKEARDAIYGLYEMRRSPDTRPPEIVLYQDHINDAIDAALTEISLKDLALSEGAPIAAPAGRVQTSADSTSRKGAETAAN